MARCLPFLLLPCAMVFAVGCGGPQTGTVSGSVTLNGRPLDKASISFIPIDGSGATAGGKITVGRYEVKNLKPTKYEVQIMGDPQGPPIMPGTPEAAKTYTAEEIRAMSDSLPADVTGNVQTVEVQAGPQSHDFKLESNSG